MFTYNTLLNWDEHINHWFAISLKKNSDGQDWIEWSGVWLRTDEVYTDFYLPVRDSMNRYTAILRSIYKNDCGL